MVSYCHLVAYVADSTDFARDDQHALGRKCFFNSFINVMLTLCTEITTKRNDAVVKEADRVEGSRSP